ncbi:hypothetical protein BJ741DRAFT_81593 [Chytriomyces cf. hyalinus JEL632]|nr:hypothetical protein BJ741DRAFT_81593 [Chytriomyces cf. hyalinus JEL632]
MIKAQTDASEALESALCDASFATSKSKSKHSNSHHQYTLQSASSATTLLHIEIDEEEHDRHSDHDSDDAYASDFDYPEPAFEEPHLKLPTVNTPMSSTLVTTLRSPKEMHVLVPAYSKFQGKTHPLIVKDVAFKTDKPAAPQTKKIIKQASSKSIHSVKLGSPINSRLTSNLTTPASRKVASMPATTSHPTKSKRSNPATQSLKKHASSLSNQIHPDADPTARLSAVIDHLKHSLHERADELKTLKIVNRRQSIALKQSDKNALDLPRLYQQQTEELRALKHAHAACGVRIALAERSSQEHLEDAIQLREKVAKSNVAGKVKAFGNGLFDGGSEGNHEELERLKSNVAALEDTVAELNKRLKYTESSNNLLLREARGKNSKLSKELEEMKMLNKELSEKLEEKSRQISAMSIYSLAHSNHPVDENKPRTNVIAEPCKQNPKTKPIRNAIKLYPQQSVHKPVLTKAGTPPIPASAAVNPVSLESFKAVSKPNRDSEIRAWNLSQTPIPTEDDPYSLSRLSRSEILKRFQILDESEETPVAIVCRRYLLMQLAALGREEDDGGGSISPEEPVKVPPMPSKMPSLKGIHKPHFEEDGRDKKNLD